MFHSADILIDGEPLLGLGALEGLVGRLACETDEVPARVHEGIERIGLAAGRPSAGWAGHVSPAIVPVERISRLVERHILRQHNRQLFPRSGNRAAAVTMDDRDRRAPIALARDAPVAE